MSSCWIGWWALYYVISIYFWWISLLELYLIATTAIFWLVFAWYMFLSSFTFNLLIWLYLKWVFVGLIFFHSANLSLLIGKFRSYTFNVIMDMLTQIIPHYYCFLSHFYFSVPFFVFLWVTWTFFLRFPF